MRKFLFVLSLLFLLIPTVSLAATFKAEENSATTTVNQTEEVKNAYLAGDSVNFSGKASQDVWAAGNSLSISGPVQGSLVVAGNVINVSSQIDHSARIMGNTVNIQGNIGSDLLAAGNSIILLPNTVVTDDFMAAGNNIDLQGKINGNVYVAGGKINLNGEVGGNVIIKNSGTITVGPNAKIKGNFEYQSTQLANINSASQILGETKYKEVKPANPSVGKVTGFFTVFSLGLLLATFLAVWLLTYIFPKFSQKLVVESATKPWENMGIGLIALVVVPAAAIILLCTIIGIPLAFIIFGFYGFVIGLAQLVVPVLTGSLLFKWLGKTKNYRVDWLTVLAGVIIVTIVKLIPFVGGLIVFMIFLMTLSYFSKIVTGFIKKERQA